MTPDATPTPEPLDQSPAQETPADASAGLHFTGKEKKTTNPDGSWTVWQEYQFGKDGPKIWLPRATGKPSNTES